MRLRRWAALLASATLAMAPLCAQALCSRTVQVPVAPIGLGVTVVDGHVGGIYPDLLRGLANKEGCALNFPVVPRARQEMMYELGLADILLPARRSPRRDGFGLFIPLIQSRAALVSLRGLALPLDQVHSLPDLLQQHELRLAVVRGYDYGDDYQQLLAGMRSQGRLVEAVDPISLVRMLDAGMAEVSIVAPTIITGALRGDAKLKTWLPRVQITTLEDLPWGESGLYVSTRSSLSIADRERLQASLMHLAKSDVTWREFQRYYPEDDLRLTVRPH